MAEYAGSDEPARAGDDREWFSVRRMARLLQVSPSGYYAHAKRVAAMELTPRQQRRADLAVKILDVHAESDGTYGAPRITAELLPGGTSVVAVAGVVDLVTECPMPEPSAMGYSPRPLAQHGLAVHPLSQLIDCPTTAERLTARIGTGPLAVFRTGRPLSEPERSPRP